MRNWLSIFLVVMAGCGGGRPDPLPQFPRVVLWAWERPERMAFLDPRAAGVAFLARTVTWREGRVSARPRLQPLEVPAGTAIMAVVRMESFTPPLPDTGAIAAEILKASTLPRVKALQIDFDARFSEREWYRDVMRRVRERLPAELPLTITALASWCLGDGWIAGAPVQDAVPMLFRMGAGEPRKVTEFPVALCRASVGISTDEIPEKLPRGRRAFIFNPRAWTKEDYDGALRWARVRQ